MRRVFLVPLFLLLLVLLAISDVPGLGKPALQLCFKTNRDYNLFAPGENIELYAYLPENLPQLRGKPGILKCKIADFSGNTAVEKVSPFIFGEEVSVSFTLEEGFYWVSAAMEVEGTKVSEGKTGIGVIPSDLASLQPEFESFFGVCHPPENLELLRRVGIRWARVDFRWRDIEKENGVFDWALTDETVRRAGEAGVMLLGILWDPPDWARKIPAGYQPTEGGIHAGWDTFPPKDLAAWGRYVYETVKRYENRVTAWEIWNEPWPNFLFFRGGTIQDYVDLLRTAYTEAKRANPNCLIVGLGGTDFKHMQQVFEAGGFPHLDVASIHHYQPGRYPEFLFPQVTASAREVMSEYAYLHKTGEKDLWLTEIGWPTNVSDFSLPGNWGGTPAEMQAKLLPRAFVLGSSLGLKKIFWYQFEPDGPDPRNFEHNQGLFFHDLTPKPSLVAYAALVRMLDNLQYGGRMDLGSRIYAHWFTNGYRGCVALWTTFQEGAKLILPRLPAGAMAFGLMGEKLELQTVGGKWRVDLSDAVVYLVSENVEDLRAVVEGALVVHPLDLAPLYMLAAFVLFLCFGTYEAKRWKSGFELASFQMFLTPPKESGGLLKLLVFAFGMVFFPSLFAYRLAGRFLYEIPCSFPTSLPGWQLLPSLLWEVLRNPLLLWCVSFAALLLYSASFSLVSRIFRAKLSLPTCLRITCWSTFALLVLLPAAFVESLASETYLIPLLIVSLIVAWIWSAALAVIGTRRQGVHAGKAMGIRICSDLLSLVVLLPLFTILLPVPWG